MLSRLLDEDDEEKEEKEASGKIKLPACPSKSMLRRARRREKVKLVCLHAPSDGEDESWMHG